jgi:hypothetical protein
MKVDLTVTFYRQEWAWPLVAYGLEQNFEHINRVILVNDEEWNTSTVSPIMDLWKRSYPPLVMLSHTHNDFGSHRCIYQGIEASETEYVAHIDGDIVLAPDSLARMFDDAAPEVLLCGLSHDVPKATKLADLPHPHAPRNDFRFEAKHLKMPVIVQKMCMARDLYLVHRREDYFAIGGHTVAWPGYGYLDYDVAMRWMMRFGKDSIRFGDGDSYHLGGLKANHVPHPENKRLFTALFKKYEKWWNEND